MIDRIYQIILVIFNKESRGNITPTEFMNVLHNVVLELYEDKLFELNRAINRGNRGLMEGGYADVSGDIRERITYYLTSATLSGTSGEFSIPSDCKRIDAIHYNGRNIEITKDSTHFYLLQQHTHTKPSLAFPIALNTGSVIKVEPDDINAISLSYLRRPLFAKWTYTVIGSREVFNPSAVDYQDVDIHPSEESAVVTRLLERFGINLGNYEVTQLAQQQKAEEFKKENSI